MSEDAFMSCEDRNYYRDQRSRAKFIPEPPSGTEFHWETCNLCEGNGTVVNPSIDASGLTAEDFAEDPDFAEAYHTGLYDITCPQCRGRRVIPILGRKPNADH